jgi:aryl-alcohol dehydrogenase-like predicted oxidoreductase
MALDSGVNLIDTADRYATGQSEEFVGRAIRAAGARDRMILATNVGGPMSSAPDNRGLSYQHIVSACQASLRRLQVQHIDLLQLHNPDFTVPLEESLRALHHLVQRGDVRHIGWCNLPAWYAAEGHSVQEAHGYEPFVSG